MGYYLHLAKQYMWHNKARTLYSVLGIALTSDRGPERPGFLLWRYGDAAVFLYSEHADQDLRGCVDTPE